MLSKKTIIHNFAENIQTMITTTPSKRIEYIDALRGFTMILVVLHHITQPSQTLLNDLFISFRMPLFFFVSGYITYKVNENISLGILKNKVITKIKVQLIPTIIFGILYTYTLKGSDFISFIVDPFKFGYWFTLVLLEIFIIYYIFQFIANKLQINRLRNVILYIISFLLMIPNAINALFESKSICMILYGLCLPHLFMYMQFFVLGVIVRQYQNKIYNFLDNKYIITYIFIFFIITFYITQTTPKTIGLYDKIIDMIKICQRYLGLMIVFTTFKKNKANFASTTKLGHILQYIGRHTLDIYLLHFFFLPKLSPFRDYIFSGYNIVFELFFGFGVSLMVIAICLVVSKILRTSDLLAHYLFGANIQKDTKQ